MLLRTLCVSLLGIACLIIAVLPAQAASDTSSSVKVIYQTPFSSDPHWTTNSPSSDYWDPSTARYHFSIEPSTGNYAYTTIDNMEGPFTFEYDVILDRVDNGAAFRFGLTGAEMDFNKGPNVISMFSNGKHENIMSLHIVTSGSKQMEVNSQSDDELTSGPVAYKGSTVRFELNRTYHVTITYDDERKMTTMQVSDKVSGKPVWSYFLNTVENIHDMNRIYLGSRGDYGAMNIYARGYIDNVRLTQPGPAITPGQTFVSLTSVTTAPPVTTTKSVVIPTHLPATTDTPQSPTASILAVLALGIIGTLGALRGGKKY
ncbi:MAG: hypothetical protein WCB46_05480 [Methanoregula sp.]